MQFENLQSPPPQESRRSNAVMTRVSAVGTAVILVGFLVMTVSRAAFVATTDNTSNFLETGELTLTDDDGGSAMFNATGLDSSGSVENCIAVTYSGDYDPSEIVLYAESVTGDLAPHLLVDVEIGTTAAGGEFDDCSAFVADSTIFSGQLDSLGTNSASSVATGWDPAITASETRSFRFTVSVNPVNGGGAGDDATFGFTWETQGG